MNDFDGSWKDALDHLLSPVLALLFPSVWAAIDWSHDHESLEQEMRELSAQGEAGLRRCDKLVKLQLRRPGEVTYTSRCRTARKRASSVGCTSTTTAARTGTMSR